MAAKTVVRGLAWSVMVSRAMPRNVRSVWPAVGEVGGVGLRAGGGFQMADIGEHLSRRLGVPLYGQPRDTAAATHAQR